MTAMLGLLRVIPISALLLIAGAPSQDRGARIEDGSPPRLRAVARRRQESGSRLAVHSDPPAVVAEGRVLEPSTVLMQRAETTASCTAYIRIVNPAVPGFNTRIQFDYAGTSGAKCSGTIPIPTENTDSSDPVLALGASADGVNPFPTYLAGITRNRDRDSTPVNPSSIRIWQSGDGGFSWNGTGSVVDSLPANVTDQILDKPALAVAQASKFIGYVYVAWIHVDRPRGAIHDSKVMFRRSRNGVLKPHVCCGGPQTWDDMTQAGDTGNWQGPQIVEDGQGYVHLFWTDLTNHRIMGARSLRPGADFDRSGNQFGAMQIISDFNRIGAGTNENVLTPLSFPIRALPLITARYDAADDRILLAWHEGETPGAANTDISFAYAPAGSGPPMEFHVIRPSSSSPNSRHSDQFTPVLDIDEEGHVLLAYYDRAGQLGGNYQETVALLDSAGNLALPAYPDQNPLPVGAPCHSGEVGEYQTIVRRPGAEAWDLTWTCGDATGTRAIHRASIRQESSPTAIHEPSHGLVITLPFRRRNLLVPRPLGDEKLFRSSHTVIKSHPKSERNHSIFASVQDEHGHRCFVQPAQRGHCKRSEPANRKRRIESIAKRRERRERILDDDAADLTFAGYECRIGPA